MMKQTLETQLDQSGCLYITLNRPEVYNALNEVMIQEFITVLEDHHSKTDVRTVILQGAGKLFCSGADLTWMKKMSLFNYQQNVEDAKALAHLMHLWDTFPRPTVVLIQGGAYGGAVGLAAAADIVLAHKDAVFCLSEVKLGLIPAVISPYVIKAIGQRQMRRYALTAERMTASDALHMGLIHDIRDDLQVGLAEILNHIFSGSPQAQATTKSLIRQVESQVIDSKIHHLTAESIAAARASQDGQEGVQAFFEKRQPRWAQRKETHS